MTHGDCSQIVIVGGVLNLASSFVTGFFLAKTRRTSPHAWKHTESSYGLVGSVLRFPERERQKMYYRVAIKSDSLPIRQWKSTVLSSLDTLFRFLRLYGALPQEGLWVFSSPSREGLQEQLVQENQGLGSNAVTAAQFLRERLIRLPERMQRIAVREAETGMEMTLVIISTQQPHYEGSVRGNVPEGRGMSSLERARQDLESGAGGDHDLPYRFTMPFSTLQVLAWIKLQARVHHGELHL
jgi:hypothetical protein